MSNKDLDVLMQKCSSLLNNTYLGTERVKNSKDDISTGDVQIPDDDSSAAKNIRPDFMRACMNFLDELMENIEDQNAYRCDDDITFSLAQKRNLKAIVELYVSFGILPCLDKGVGIPVEIRTKNWKIIAEDAKNISENRLHRLSVAVDKLCKLARNCSTQEFVIPTHLGDLLAALIQLCHSPISSVAEKTLINTTYTQKDQQTTYTQKDKHTTYIQKEKHAQELSLILRNTYQPLVIQKLMLLNGKNTPKWMLSAVTSYLTERVMASGGVISTIKALCDVDSSSPLQSSVICHLAKLITTLPPNMKPSLYYKDVAPQIVDLCRWTENTSSEAVYYKIGFACVKNLYEKQPRFTLKYIMRDLYSGLFEPRIETSESDISFQVENLYVGYASPGMEIISIPDKCIEPIIITLFNMYCLVWESASHLKGPLKKIISKYCSRDCAAAFDTFIFNDNLTITSENRLNVAFGSEGGVKFSAPPEDNLSILERGLVISEAIKNETDTWDDQTSAFFLYLLKRFSKTRETNNKKLEETFAIIALLTNLSSDQNAEKILKKEKEVASEFVYSLLVGNDVSAFSHYQDDITTTALIILTVILKEEKLPANKLREPAFIKRLESLKMSPSQSVSTLAGEVLDKLTSRLNCTNDKPTSKFGMAMSEVNDSLLPTRAHALQELISLMKKNDPEARAKLDAILCLFVQNLKDHDSYIYLRAVEGLATIAVYNTEKVCHLLCEEFISQNRGVKLRLKVGESIMRVIRYLDNFATKYKNLLLNTFLTGCRDEDYILRASSLSNLAELCGVLHYSLGTIIAEVLLCLRCILESDKHIEPRRAAVMVVAQLLKGLENRTFDVLGQLLPDLYRSLRRLYCSDKDTVVRLHAQIALDYLSSNTMDILTPKNYFSK